MNTLTLLKRLISIPSVFPEEEKLSLFLSDYLKTIGFHIEYIQTDINRQNIIATFGSSKKYLGFYGHIDTVSPDPNYTRNPYKTYVNKDRVYGLGAADMKGGITAILKLAEFATIQNIPIKIILGVDEENISQGAHDLVNSGKMNDVSFLISAESGQIKNINQKYSLCFGRKGRILFEFTVSGKRSHAAEKSGRNAINDMATFLTHLDDIDFSFDKHLGETRLIIHTINGNTDSFSIPDSCSTTISALTNPQTNLKDIQKKLMNLGKQLGITIQVSPVERLTPYGESYVVNPKNWFFKKLQKNIFLPNNQEGIYTDSVADENVFANRLHIPVLALGPVGGGDHIADEWVSISSIENVISTYQKILQLFHAKQK